MRQYFYFMVIFLGFALLASNESLAAACPCQDQILAGASVTTHTGYIYDARSQGTVVYGVSRANADRSLLIEHWTRFSRGKGECYTREWTGYDLNYIRSDDPTYVVDKFGGHDVYSKCRSLIEALL